MGSQLNRIASLVKDTLFSSQNDSYKLAFIPNDEEKQLLEDLERQECVQEIVSNGKVIFAREIGGGSMVTVEIIQFGLKKFGYYDNFQEFINNNEFSAPAEFFIKDLDYLHSPNGQNAVVNAYLEIINLIDCLSALSLFQSNEGGKTLYIMQEKSATALPIVYDRKLIEENSIDITEITSFISEITGQSDRRKIYIKELIDHLNTERLENRFCHLYKQFPEFYRKCEAAYAFFLSDFSYGKLRLELESSILDFSKNIRSIINDSQTKLIAIPAAFIVASTQLDFKDNLLIKNVLIVISSYVFSMLIEIFLRNQESSLKIFVDNVNNYKTTFKIKNESAAEKENETLQSIISMSFKAVDDELVTQRKRLNLIRVINWGLSIFLTVVVLLLFEISFIGNLIFTIPRPIFNIHICR